MAIKLVRISIEKLFGQFDYTINLNQKDDITILTGPNGYGKTTILNIVYSIFNEEFTKIQLFNLKRLAFLFDNGQTIVYHEGKPPINTKNILELIKSTPVSFIKDQRIFQHVIPQADGLFKYDGTIKADEKPVEINTINMYSHDLCKKIREKQNEEKKIADELAPSLTKRFKDYKIILPDSEYRERFQKLAQKYRRLQEYGIYQNDLESTEYEGDDKRFFSLNLEDWEQKTAVYDELLGKIDLFLKLLNEKQLTNKTVGINGREGFCFTTTDAKPLELTALSSGEQNEIIMLYDLLFKALPGTLVLIDEPETSMHVAWQLEFISDLRRIAALNPLSFLIATHSPDLINDKESIDLWALIHGEADDGE